MDCSIKCLLANVYFFVRSLRRLHRRRRRRRCRCRHRHHTILFNIIFAPLYSTLFHFYIYLLNGFLLFSVSHSPCPFSPRFTFILSFFYYKNNVTFIPFIYSYSFFAIYFILSFFALPPSSPLSRFSHHSQQTHQSNDTINESMS